MNKKTFIPVVLLLLLLFFGCVSSSAPGSGSNQGSGGTESGGNSRRAPDWFFKTPEEDATFKYFVGSGMSESGNVAEAEDGAILDLTDTILMYIGIEVTSETEALGIGSIDDFRTEITQVVSSKGKARISGFEIMEKLPHETEDGLLIYILARYNKRDLEAEKKKIQREIEEKYEAVSLPEEEGKKLVSQGRYYEAAIKFIQAADAAANEIVANARIKFERNINQAMDAIGKINLIPLSRNIEGLVGQPLPESFRIKVVSGGSQSAPGIPGVTIRVSYKTFNAAKTRLNIRTLSLKTDNDGMLAFEHPLPEFTGTEKVTMLLDFDEYLEILDDIPATWYDAVDALDELIVNKKIDFEFKVISNARNIDTGVIIIDLDESNQMIPGTRTGAALLQQVSAQQYKVRNIYVAPEDILERGDFEIIEKLATDFSSQVRRVIYGTARVLEISEDNGRFIVKTTATIQVVDLVTREILLSIVKTANGMGNNADQATLDSFKRLGTAGGKEILNNLR